MSGQNPFGTDAALEDDQQLAAMGPAYVAAYRRLHDAALRRNALTAAERELVLLGVNVALHLFDRDGVEYHLRRALKAGATSEQVKGVLAMCLGSHTITQSVPVLLEELERSGQPVKVPTADTYDDDQRMLREEHEHGRGFWYDGWHSMLGLDGEFLDAYLSLASVGYPRLEARLQELVNIGMDVATTHLYMSGTRVHIRHALAIGATREQITEVIELVSLVGYRSLFLGLSVLSENPPTGETWEEL